MRVENCCDAARQKKEIESVRDRVRQMLNGKPASLLHNNGDARWNIESEWTHTLPFSIDRKFTLGQTFIRQ